MLQSLYNDVLEELEAIFKTIIWPITILWQFFCYLRDFEEIVSFLVLKVKDNLHKMAESGDITILKILKFQRAIDRIPAEIVNQHYSAREEDGMDQSTKVKYQDVVVARRIM